MTVATRRPSHWPARVLGDHLLRQPLLAVIGPAGAGKSTFLEAVLALAAERGHTTRRLDSTTEWDETLAALASDVGVVGVDDVHLVAEPARLEEAVNRRIADGLVTVLTGRDDLPFPWRRWLGRGQASEIGFTTLLLSPGQVAKLVDDSGLEIDPEEIAELHALTSGWPAPTAIIVAERLRGRVDHWPTGDALRYLRTEVVVELPDQLRWLLTRMAHLPLLDPETARVALDSDTAATLLEDVIGRHLFLLPASDRPQTHRMPAIIAEALRSHPSGPSAEERRSLQHAASLLYERRSQWDEAVGLMLQANPEHALRQLTRMIGAHEPFGRSTTTLKWFRRLPGELRAQPSATLGLAQALLQAGHTSEAEELLERSTPGQWTRRDEVAEFFVVRSQAHRVMFRHEDAARTAEAALELINAGLPCSDSRTTFLRLVAEEQLHELRAWEGDPTVLTEVSLGVRNGEVRTTFKDLSLLHAMGLSALLMCDAGRFDDAHERAEATLRMAERREYGDSHLTSEAWLALGLVAAERDDLTVARSHLELAHERARVSLFPTTVARVELALVEVLARLGERETARERLDVALDRAREVDDPVLRSRLLATLATVDLLSGNHGQLAPTSHRLRGVSTPGHVVRTRMRCALALDAVADLSPIADTLTADGTPASRVAAALCRAHLLRSQAPLDAAAALLEALRVAEAEGMWRSMLELAFGLESLLPQLADGADPVHGPTPRHVRRFSDELARIARSRQALLSPRELEVAHYLGSRLTNGQIADELFISENTVKTHLRHIYQKLGVEQRDEAVRQLTELGIILDR